MQINANKVLDICLKVWYKGANANDSHYHLEGYTKMYGSYILPEPTVATQDWVHRGYAMAFVQDALRMGWIAMDNLLCLLGVCALAYVCNFQTAFSISGFFSGITQKFLLIGGNLISLLVLFFFIFNECVNQWGLVVGCVNFPQCLQGV